MITIPTSSQISQLHHKYAPNPEIYKEVHDHSVIVAEIASQLASHALGLNLGLLEAGCLLHDLGVYSLYDSAGHIAKGTYIRHGVLGYDILKQEGLDEALCRFASCHTGVGLTKEEIISKHLPLPPKDYFAETPEERLVMYADKFHSKIGPGVFNSYDFYTRDVAQHGPGRAEKFAQLAAEIGKPDLTPLALKYRQEIR